MAAPEKNPSTPDAHRALPEKKTVETAGEHLIKDEKGNEIAFKSLYTDKPAGERQLIVFVRHFFCGVSLFLWNENSIPLIAADIVLRTLRTSTCPRSSCRETRSSQDDPHNHRVR